MYSTDGTFDDHARRADAEATRTMHGYQHGEPWFVARCQRPGAERAALWLAFYRERFRAIADDLRQLDGPVLAEGVDLLPCCVLPVASPGRAAWLVPTRPFYEARHFARERARRRDPGTPTDDGWAFYQHTIDDTRRRLAAAGMSPTVVDGEASPGSIAADLATLFGLDTGRRGRVGAAVLGPSQ